MSVTTTRKAIAEHRLKMRWSFEELAADITRVTARPISGATLHRLIHKKHTRKPDDQTLYTVEQYLASTAVAGAPVGSR